MIWLLRLKRWVERPPSPRLAKFIVAVILAAFMLYLVEIYLGWPEWLTVNPPMQRLAPLR